MTDQKKFVPWGERAAAQAAQRTGRTPGAAAQAKPSRGWGHALAAVVLLAAAAGGVWLWFAHSSGSEPKDVAPTKPASVKKAPPSHPPTKVKVPERVEAPAKAEVPKKPVAAQPPQPPQQSQPDEPYKVIRRPGQRPYRVIPAKPSKSPFHSFADQQIARILLTEPGKPLIGTFRYDRFPEQFKKALETPIVISSEDSPEIAAQKRMVIETREELKAAMDRGENIGDVMREAEAELHRLYEYRINLQKELIDARKEGKMGATDFSDYVNAANQMLKEHGLAPLKHPEFWVRAMRLREERAK